MALALQSMTAQEFQRNDASRLEILSLNAAQAERAETFHASGCLNDVQFESWRQKSKQVRDDGAEPFTDWTPYIQWMALNLELGELEREMGAVIQEAVLAGDCEVD